MCLLVIGDDEQRWFVIMGDSDKSHWGQGACMMSNSVQLVTTACGNL